MEQYETTRISRAPEKIAPDGSRVRPLLSLESGSVAHFRLEPGQVSQAVRHRRVGEIWLVLSGRGLIWRRLEVRETVVELEHGVCVSIPAGTAFQFRCSGSEPLCVVAVTMPPWPGDDEAIKVKGKWERDEAGAN